jgi:hypothetical protein
VSRQPRLLSRRSSMSAATARFRHFWMRSIDPRTPGLRCLVVLAYTFARIGAVVKLNAKKKNSPSIANSKELLDEYLKATGLEKEPQSPLFLGRLPRSKSSPCLAVSAFAGLLRSNPCCSR